MIYWHVKILSINFHNVCGFLLNIVRQITLAWVTSYTCAFTSL